MKTEVNIWYTAIHPILGYNYGCTATKIERLNQRKSMKKNSWSMKNEFSNQNPL